jgi:TonB family protein
VILEVLIGIDGTVRDVQVSSGDPDLGSAATEAVRQWEFSPTYLNCTPVEVHMNVTANFVAK